MNVVKIRMTDCLNETPFFKVNFVTPNENSSVVINDTPE